MRTSPGPRPPVQGSCFEGLLARCARQPGLFARKRVSAAGALVRPPVPYLLWRQLVRGFHGSTLKGVFKRRKGALTRENSGV